jgi:hypothetical protein
MEPEETIRLLIEEILKGIASDPTTEEDTTCDQVVTPLLQAAGYVPRDWRRNERNLENKAPD